jgi:hypothetical protein
MLLKRSFLYFQNNALLIYFSSFNHNACQQQHRKTNILEIIYECKSMNIQLFSFDIIIENESTFSPTQSPSKEKNFFSSIYLIAILNIQ